MFARGGTIIIDSHHRNCQICLRAVCKYLANLNFIVKMDLMSKIRKLVRLAPPIDFKVKKPVPKRNLQFACKAKNEPPMKRKKDKASDTSVIDLDKPLTPFVRDIAKEDPWVSFGRCTLTTVDKDIIMKGTIIAVHVANLQNS